jgi:cytochrome b involved in lipid metabolism
VFTDLVTSILPHIMVTGGAKVYDVTKYLNDHPGGPEIMMEFAGK